MKLILPLLALILSGCSTFGEVEALNDIGLGDAREVVHVYNESLNVLGITSTTPNASKINRFYGQTQNVAPSGSLSDIPFNVRDINELFRYLP